LSDMPRSSLWLHYRWHSGGRSYGRMYEVNDPAHWGPATARNIPFDARGRLWYRKAREKRGLYWSPPYRFLAAQRPGVTASMPLIDGERVVDVCGIGFELRDLSSFARQLSQEPGSKVFLLTYHRAKEHPDSS